jgi:hypothetical protein
MCNCGRKAGAGSFEEGGWTSRGFGDARGVPPPQVRSFAQEHFHGLSVASAARLTALRGTAAAGVSTFNQVHVTSAGDALVSTGRAAGNIGDVVLNGSIGPIPYEIHLHFELDAGMGEITVTLKMEKPIQAGPYTWKFKLHGIVRDSMNNIVAASDVVASDIQHGVGIAPFLNWGCVLKCGGLGILGALVTCLPSLVGGPAAYITCVTGQAGAGAASIAACIAKECA